MHDVISFNVNISNTNSFNNNLGEWFDKNRDNIKDIFNKDNIDILNISKYSYLYEENKVENGDIIEVRNNKRVSNLDIKGFMVLPLYNENSILNSSLIEIIDTEFNKNNNDITITISNNNASVIDCYIINMLVYDNKNHIYIKDFKRRTVTESREIDIKRSIVNSTLNV